MSWTLASCSWSQAWEESRSLAASSSLCPHSKSLCSVPLGHQAGKGILGLLGQTPLPTSLASE